MRNIIIALIIFVLAVGAYLLFQPPKTTKKQTPVAPGETPPSTNFLDHMTEEELIHYNKIEPELKRARVYAGDMNVVPPCPRDTHEDEGFCRKGASKYDTNIVFIGSHTFDMEACRPDQCKAQCKKACEDAAGEKCTLNDDIDKECLKDFPPGKIVQDETELREQRIQCRSRYYTYYQHYRCTYDTNEDEQFRYVRTASDEECRQMYDAYQKCRNALAQKEVIPGKSYTSTEEELRCSGILNDEFSPARCVLAWNEADQRPYAKAAPDRITCSYQCN